MHNKVSQSYLTRCPKSSSLCNYGNHIQIATKYPPLVLTTFIHRYLLFLHRTFICPVTVQSQNIHKHMSLSHSCELKPTKQRPHPRIYSTIMLAELIVPNRVFLYNSTIITWDVTGMKQASVCVTAVGCIHHQPGLEKQIQDQGSHRTHGSHYKTTHMTQGCKHYLDHFQSSGEIRFVHMYNHYNIVITRVTVTPATVSQGCTLNCDDNLFIVFWPGF